MVRSTFTAGLLATGLLASGCASSPGTRPTAFDGTYSGTITSIHTSANSCATTAPRPGTLSVSNGAVVWAASATATPMYAPVMQDGAFQAATNALVFSGKITDRAMVARVNTGSCHMIYDLTKAT